MKNQYLLLNECTRHLSRSKNPYAAMTLCTSNGVFTIEKVNDSIVVSNGQKPMIDVQNVTHLRIKHDSVILCTRRQLLMFHGETNETYVTELPHRENELHDMDVYYNPFRREMVAWYLFYNKGNNKMILQKEDECIDSWFARNSGFDRLDVLRQDLAIVSAKKTRVYHEGQQSLFSNDLRILETSYMYNLNKYLLQTNEFFMLLDDSELQFLFENGIKATSKRVDDSQLFYTPGVCKDIHFTRYQDFVLYACGRSRLCIAETKYPYKINPNVVVPLDHNDKIHSFEVDYIHNKIHVSSCTQDYVFSMFPLNN